VRRRSAGKARDSFRQNRALRHRHLRSRENHVQNFNTLTWREVTATEVPLTDLRGERRAFVTEAVNQHSLFVMLTAKKATRFGIRVRAVAS